MDYCAFSRRGKLIDGATSGREGNVGIGIGEVGFGRGFARVQNSRQFRWSPLPQPLAAHHVTSFSLSLCLLHFLLEKCTWSMHFIALISNFRLGRLQDSNAVLSHFNDFSQHCFAEISGDMARNTRLLKSIKSDLDYIFLKLRYCYSIT